MPQVDFAKVLKFNPYHDSQGRFTSEYNADHPGPAATLAARPRPNKTLNDVINDALSTPEQKAEFYKAYVKANDIYQKNQTTHSANTKPGTNAYTPERLKLHRQIIAHILKNAQDYKPASGEKPTMIMLGGRGGSGKSNFSNHVNPDVGVYDPKKFLVLDSDNIKSLLPEFNPETVTTVHEESFRIFDKAVAAARHAGLNVVLDFTMNSDKSDWVKEFQKKGYRTEAYYVHRPADLSSTSAIQRWASPLTTTDIQGNVKTFTHGRIIPLNPKSSDKAERNFDKITSKVDKWALYDNSKPTFEFKKVAEGGKDLKSKEEKEVSGWKKVGGQGGSNPGGVFEDEKGTRHYVKFPQVNPEQARAEKVADDVYRTLGIPSKESQVVKSNGKLGLAGKMLEGAKELPQKEINASPDVKKGYVADAYLANWDVFGMSYDNIVKAKDGKDYRIDNGGTLFYRAQGKPKDYPSDKVEELQSLIAPDKKGNKAYGNLPKEEVVAQAKNLVDKLTDAKLHSIIEGAGIKGEAAQKYFKAMQGRREVIKNTILSQKFDPYHDAEGKFTSPDNAVKPGWYKSKSGKNTLLIDEKGIIAGGTNKTQNVPVEKQHLGAGPFKTQEEAVQGFHNSVLAEALKPQPITTTPEPKVEKQPEKPKESPMTGVPAGEIKYEKELEFQKAKGAVATAGTGKSYVMEKGTQITPEGKLSTHAHQFYNLQKATESFDAVKEAYAKNGFTVKTGKNPGPGNVGVEQKNSQILVYSHLVPKKEEVKPVEKVVPPVKTAPKPLVPKPTGPKQPSASQLAKQKEKIEKYKNELATKHFEFTLLANDLKNQGKNSAAKAKLTQVANAEKPLITAGMKPEELAEFKSGLQKKLDDYIKGEQDKKLAEWVEAEKQLVKSGDEYYSYYGNKPYLAAYNQALNQGEHPSIHKGQLYQRTAQSIVKYQKHQALQSIAEHVAKQLGNSDFDPKDEKLDALSKEAIGLGAKPSEMTEAHKQGELIHAGNAPEKLKFNSKEEALEHLKKAALNFYVEKASNPFGYEWNMTEAQTKLWKEHMGKEHKKYQAAKDAYVQLGGEPKEFPKLASIAQFKASDIAWKKKYEKQAAQNEAVENLKTASKAYHQSVFDKGEEHPDTLEAKNKVATLEKEAQEKGASTFMLKTANMEAQVEFNNSIQEQKQAAHSKVSDALYDYHYKNETLGADHPETKEAKTFVDHAKETEKKFVPEAEYNQLESDAKTKAQTAKAFHEKLKSLGVDVQKTVQDYDKQASTFKQPLYGDDVQLASLFQQHAEKQINAMTPKQRGYVIDYTGGGFKLLNKQVGGAAVGATKVDSTRRKMMESMDAVLQKSTLGYNVKLQRKMPAKYIWQGLGIPRPKTDAEAQKLVGKIYTEHAYGSTTMVPGSVGSMASSTEEGTAVLKIRAVKDIHGLRVKDISNHPSENEVILARGMTYVIRSAKKDGSTYVFDVDAIGDYPKQV